MTRSETIGELATAFAKFQGKVESVKKDAANPFYKSHYSTLASVIDVVRTPLSENGLSFVQFPSTEHGDGQSLPKLELTTTLFHASGEYLQGTYSMIPTDNKPQTIGSCLSYMRRYGLMAILGIASEDDDANIASNISNTGKSKQKEPATGYKIQKDTPPVTEDINDFIQ